jgi:hypothetical protein
MIKVSESGREDDLWTKHGSNNKSQFDGSEESGDKISESLIPSYLGIFAYSLTYETTIGENH